MVINITNFPYKTLELDKVLNMLANETCCNEAYQKALSIAPESSLSKVNKRLKETEAAFILQGKFGSPHFGGIYDIKESLTRASSGGSLNNTELLNIARTLNVYRSISDWKKQSMEMNTSIDYLFKRIHSNRYLEDKINKAIISEDEISDSASETLSQIRRKLKIASNKVRERLDKLIHSPAYQKYLQDPIVTIRENRFVVPVKSEYKSNIQGLVHDTSSSGATVFIEPVSVLEANNDIKILKAKESAEIERILMELSLDAAGFKDSIIESYNAVIKLNIIFSKASIAYKMKASLPIMNDQSRISLKKARHPLIPPEKIVPIDINLGIKFDTLVITGPNTGGKTVSLKTVGLLTLMAMCGMMIPAADNSELSVFENIFCDIGDEQSIEQSLSTFSAHMKNIINIQKKANANSLILLDELGAGTDPVEGAALATSILENLRHSKAKIVATTHYAELKVYALNTNGVENGCCEFNLTTLRPTYKLIIGIPGKSNAFAISERLGMSKKIINRAKEFLSYENERFESVVEDLEKSRQALEQERKIAQESTLNAKIKQEEAQKIKNLIEKKYEKEIEKAKLDARNIISKAKAQAQALIEEVDKLNRKKSNITQEERLKLKSDIKKLQNDIDPIDKKINEGYVLPRKLKVGDEVLIFDLDKKATVLELPDKSDNVLVQAGIIKTRVSLKNLRLLKSSNLKVPKRTITKNNISIKTSTSIDLRGMTAFEATIELDKFIDSAILSKINQITIIHGKGTGVLRKEISSYLKKHPSIKSFRLGTFGEGESGVTVAELK